jgi:orotate phosphoribosyltransferase
MSQSHSEVATFLASTNAVRFGDFTLKSGVSSPVFVDMGKLASGSELREIGRHFADCLTANKLTGVEVLFGPSYKGIPLAVATSIALFERQAINVGVASSRKEAKEHSEGGLFIGADLETARSVVVLDDVFTNGGTKYEVIDLLQQFPALSVEAVVVAVNRSMALESTSGEVEAFQARTGVPVIWLCTIDDVMNARIPS